MISKKFLLVLIVTAIVTVICALLFFSFYFSPSVIFYRKFGFKLPHTSKILEHEYYLFDEQRFVAKILFDEMDYKKIIEDLLEYCESYGIIEERLNYSFADIDSAYAPWWDMKLKDLAYAVSCRTDSRATIRGFEIYASTGMPMVHVFITVNDDEEYFLYVYH